MYFSAKHGCDLYNKGDKMHIPVKETKDDTLHHHMSTLCLNLECPSTLVLRALCFSVPDCLWETVLGGTVEKNA